MKPNVDAYKYWFSGRLNNADRLVNVPGATVNDARDAEIILCCALAAAASDLWGGQKIDKRRFVELLVLYGKSSHPSPNYVSVPTLGTYLQRGDFTNNKLLKDIPKIEIKRWVTILSDHFRNSQASMIAGHLKWSDVDEVDEKVVDWLSKSSTTISSDVVRKIVRSYSYADIMYKDLRCGLVHEHGVKGRLAQPGIIIDSEPYYMNWFDLEGQLEIRLCLPYEYTRDCVQRTFAGICDKWGELANNHTSKISAMPPTEWWLDGRP
jgi:hypothetical protein